MQVLCQSKAENFVTHLIRCSLPRKATCRIPRWHDIVPYMRPVPLSRGEGNHVCSE